MYRDRLVNHNVFASDYPMMFWLQNVFAAGERKIFDLGGHVGVAYYVYQRFMNFPDDVSWTVHDVPAVMSEGRKLASELDPARRLTFADKFDQAAECDVLFTSGCLQYLQDTLADRIQTLKRQPRWIIINLLPLHQREAYWTVQSIRTSYCPYRIQHTGTFLSDIKRLGYVVADKWENLDKDCWIAFDPEHSLDRYFGLALRAI